MGLISIQSGGRVKTISIHHLLLKLGATCFYWWVIFTNFCCCFLLLFTNGKCELRKKWGAEVFYIEREVMENCIHHLSFNLSALFYLYCFPP